MDLSDLYDQLLAVLKQSDADTAFAEFTATSGEYEPALFDLCHAAINSNAKIPDKLADLLVQWLSDYELMSATDRDVLTKGINQRREPASPS